MGMVCISDINRHAINMPLVKTAVGGTIGCMSVAFVAHKVDPAWGSGHLLNPYLPWSATVLSSSRQAHSFFN